MVPRLEYIDNTHKKRFLGRLFGASEREPQSIWWFLNESLRLHKAPILESLDIELGPHCPVDANVGKWIANAVDRRVRELGFQLMWSAGPTSLPKSLYTCDTLVYLRLSNKVFVDVSSPILCPILEYLYVFRHDQDNVTNFSVKVPSLETLTYCNVKPKVVGEEDVQDIGGSLAIDSKILKEFAIIDTSPNSCSIENKPRLDKVVIYVYSYPDDKFMRSLSSVRYLEIYLRVTTVPCCHAINFSQLIECNIRPYNLDWFEPLVSLLQNSPELKVLLIDQTFETKASPLSFKQPNDVPLCLSTKLKIFEWNEYRGTSEENHVLSYILANSKCLKRAGISLKSTWKWNKKKIMKELKSMYRISTTSQLL
ncbi:unnamed protein product, partial [Arabidopsis halleri]